MLSKHSALENLIERRPIHMRRRFESRWTGKIAQWLAEAIDVFGMVELDEARRLGRRRSKCTTAWTRDGPI